MVPSQSLQPIRLHTLQRFAFFLCAAVILIWDFANLALPGNFVTPALACLVAFVGLPHGALDPIVAHRANLWQSRAGLILFLITYLLLAAIALAFWILFPGWALALFLAYSAWHFAGDWREDLTLTQRLFAGLTIIAGPSLLHADEVISYFTILSLPSPAVFLVQFLQWTAFLCLPAVFLIALRNARLRPFVSLELTILAITATFLPPLVFFLLYFCVQHSPRHLIHASAGIPPSVAVPVAFTVTALSVAGGFFAYALLQPTSWDHGVIQVVFTGLAILTVPHMLLIECAEGRNLPRHSPGVIR